jgi:hypothetical protein
VKKGKQQSSTMDLGEKGTGSIPKVKTSLESIYQVPIQKNPYRANL